MHKIHVGVLRGGPSSEHEVSLKTGETAIRHIPQDGYDVHDIFISTDGQWHRHGVPITPTSAISKIDVIFNALHGHYGEDGKIQHILETHGIPFTGSGSFSSAVGMNKALAKEIFKKEKIKTPQYKTVEGADNLTQEKLISLFRSFPLPLVIKPASSGSSVGVALVKDFTSFEAAVRKAFEYGDTVLIEEYIPGVEATVTVIDEYREVPVYVLPVLDPHKFNNDQKVEIENTARRVHEAFGFRHYSRTDFIVSPTRGIFVLEVNTLPGLTEESSLPRALEAVGSSLSHFFDHVLRLAMKK